MRRIIVFLVVFVLLAGLVGGLGYFQFVFKPAMIKGIISQAPRPVPTVATAQARVDTWVPRVPAIGTFRAIKGIDISPQVAGVIQKLNFQSGQDVAEGTLLVQLDDAVEKADLANNLATLKNAELSLTRQLQLITGGATPRSNVDAAEAARDSAAAAVERSRALITQKALTAPFAGRLGLLKIDAGQYVSVGTSIVTLQALDPIFVDFPIPEQELASLRIGQEVDLMVDPYPGQNFSGKIASIDTRVSSDTRNVLVRAEVANPDRKLLPGMFANVGVLSGKPQEVVSVPRTAITYSLYGDSVFVVKPAPPPAGSAQAATTDQQFLVEQRPVKVGETREDRVAVLDGVTAGEQVISEGQVKLLPNARVRIDDHAGLPAAASPRPKE